METSPSSAASQDTARKRTATPGMVITALLVPLMTVAALATSMQTEDIEQVWADRQREVCRHMPFPVTDYVAAWAGLSLGVTTVVVCVLLAKRIYWRLGLRLWRTWPGMIACVGVGFSVLTIPMEIIQLCVAYSLAGSGINLGDCE